MTGEDRRAVILLNIEIKCQSFMDQFHFTGWNICITDVTELTEMPF